MEGSGFSLFEGTIPAFPVDGLKQIIKNH